ncbi:hypothetical protein BDZ85DRAFT_285977 [Elsinoe ampelina]|uniref:Uncharacterized protein n=1 Tax=Elsinoe ampelina TaxID=302913 RepID=A0A6A6FZA6_9PEZI|nr:hypothetical protein BDZ85DRAFT_285977 [Elsinoe ampelina]
MSGQAASLSDRIRSEESWIEIASQPSSSSLSSAGGDIVTTGLRVQRDMVARRKRRQRTTGPTSEPQHATNSGTLADASSQEEYEESESESDQVMTSSNEGLIMGGHDSNQDEPAMSDDDENRTAVNYPIRRRGQTAFTPQPNAFSHPPSSTTMRHASEPCPGSYFPQMSARPAARSNTRHSFSAQESRVQHSPYNALSPSHNAAAHHDAALRASLSTLLSCAAAARGLPKLKSTQPSTTAPPPPSDRIQPNTFRLIPQSQLPGATTQTRQRLEPDFLPTIRQRSTSSTSDSANGRLTESAELHKRKNAGERSSSKDRRMKKARRSPSASSSASSMYSTEEMLVSPTLLTWVVSAGVVVVLSAISFSAGYSIGREAGKVEGAFGGVVGGGEVSCAGETARAGTGLGLRRLRFAVQA